MTKAKKAYREFLKSDFWSNISAACKERDKMRCRKCRSKRHLQAHHVTYPEDWFDTNLSHLVTLCRKCHAKEHGKTVGKRLTSPEFIMLPENILFSNLWCLGNTSSSLLYLTMLLWQDWDSVVRLSDNELIKESRLEPQEAINALQWLATERENGSLFGAAVGRFIEREKDGWRIVEGPQFIGRKEKA